MPPLLAVRMIPLGLSVWLPVEVRRSPAWTKCREPCALKGVAGEKPFETVPVDAEPVPVPLSLRSSKSEELLALREEPWLK